MHAQPTTKQRNTARMRKTRHEKKRATLRTDKQRHALDIEFQAKEKKRAASINTPNLKQAVDAIAMNIDAKKFEWRQKYAECKRRRVIQEQKKHQARQRNAARMRKLRHEKKKAALRTKKQRRSLDVAFRMKEKNRAAIITVDIA